MAEVIEGIISGIAAGIPYFLAAAGLTLMFGVVGVLNFALGGLFMVGAYLLHSFVGGGTASWYVFILAVLAAGIGCGVLSAGTEQLGFSRLYSQGRESLNGMLLSFGLLLVITGLVPHIWGDADLLQNVPRAWSGRVSVGSVEVTKYEIVILVFGLVIIGAVYAILRRSAFGRNMLAVSYDRGVAEALGISSRFVSLASFALGGFLAGIAGALIAPMGAINSSLGENYLLYAFVAVALGGLGSIPGAFVGAIVIGIVGSMLSLYANSLAPFGLYIAAGAILLIRPNGLAPSQLLNAER